MATTDYDRILGVVLHGGELDIVVDNADIVQLYFIEDIYSWLKCGKLQLKDTRTITEFLPLVGDESITITYSSWVNGDIVEREYDFDIFKVSDIEDISESTVGTRERATMYGVEMFFVEEYHHKLHSAHYSRMYLDKPYDEIVMDIFDRFVGLPGFVEREPIDAWMRQEFHTGLRTPAECIKWLTNRVTGAESHEAGYLFYSNTKETKNSYNMNTLEKLLKDGPVLPPADGLYTMGGKNQNYINHMRNISISCIDQTSCNNLMKCNYLGYDHMRKYMIKREYEYMESKDHFTILGAFTLFNGSYLKSKILKPKEVLTGESGDSYHLAECLMDNMYYSDWIKQYCLQQLVSVNVRGDVRRYAGGHLYINWLSGNTDAMFNENYMGRYLIKSITHQFSGVTRPAYIQKMVLIKNGYWNSQSYLTPAGKVNLARIEEKAPAG